ncbi:hypothetical protein EEB14_43575 [Rhodococcus sp. WS4]|nr:hypothetical protein EEB14_43575 [Rhodococcus sp. WS4]
MFVAAFVLLFGVLAGNLPPFPASADPEAVWQNYADNRLRIMIGLSLLMTFAACYIMWSVAVAKVMERIEGAGGMWSQIERLGATITFAPPLLALVLWIGAAHEIHNIDPGTAHLLYWMGWSSVDLAYFVTSLQIIAVTIVFMRDRRENKLVPAAVNWWGWVTVAAFFLVLAIPYVNTGPLAFDGVLSFWIAYGTWFIWISLVSYFIIKAIDRLEAEDAAAAQVSVRS